MIRTLPQILAQIRRDDPNTSITCALKTKFRIAALVIATWLIWMWSRPISTSINTGFCGCTDKI